MSKFCHNCGAQLKETSKFCPKCGTPLRHREHPEQIQQAPQPIQQAVQQVAQPVRQAAQNVVGQAAEPITQAAQNFVGQVAQPQRQAVQQVVHQAGQQFGQRAAGQTMGDFGGMQNVFNALSAPGEAAIPMPGLDTAGLSSAASSVMGAASTVKSAAKGGIPGVVIALISVFAGIISALLLKNVQPPWSVVIGFLISGITVGVSAIMKKAREGGGK